MEDILTKKNNKKKKKIKTISIYKHNKKFIIIN